MLGIPLHPIVVHFPIVFSILLPISALLALWAIRRGTTPRRAWTLPVVLAAALAVSSFAALETGEDEEDRVERVVVESAIHGHEEAAERFLVLSGVLFLVSAGGLLPRTAGQAARIVATAGAVALVASAVQVGHSGGELVYKYDAGRAYSQTGGAADTAAGYQPRQR